MPRSPTTSSRTKCPFYASKGVKGWVRRHLSNRTKDCHSCPYVDKAVIKTKLEEQYPTDKWEHSYISESGGYVVTERQRINEGKQNSRERGIFNKEQSMCKVLAEHGHHVSHLRGKNRDEEGSYDILLDRISADLKSFHGAGSLIKQVKHAYEEQGAKIVVVRLETDKVELFEKLLEARRKLTGRILYYRESEKILRELL